MTVTELIRELQTFPGHLPVRVQNRTDELLNDSPEPQEFFRNACDYHTPATAVVFEGNCVVIEWYFC